MQRQQQDAATLQEDVKLLREQNAALQKNVKLLQGEAPGAESYLEDVIREELGYVKADEHLLLFDAQPDAAVGLPKPGVERP